MISGDTWFVQFNEIIYGPYTTGQMNEYILEGRVTAKSWITTNPSQPFKNASDFLNFTLAFQPNFYAPTPSVPHAHLQTKQASFRKKNHFGLDVHELSNPIEQNLSPAENERSIAPLLDPSDVTGTQLDPPDILLETPIEADTPVEGTQRNDQTVILIMAELKTDQTMKFLMTLQLCGVAERISHSVWLLRTSLSATDLRNRLNPTLSDTERLFIMDSFNGQTAWSNIGSDMDARIRKLWGA